MSVADEYRAKAAKLAAEASKQGDPVRRAELESLERSYLRLALQANKNARVNIVYETPRAPPVMQQQQQAQAKKKPKKQG